MFSIIITQAHLTIGLHVIIEVLVSRLTVLYMYIQYPYSIDTYSKVSYMYIQYEYIHVQYSHSLAYCLHVVPERGNFLSVLAPVDFSSVSFVPGAADVNEPVLISTVGVTYVNESADTTFVYVDDESNSSVWPGILEL